MAKYKIALFPGDGVGPEVTAEAVKIMEAAGKSFDVEFEATEFGWGVDYWLKNGRIVPEDYLDQLKKFDVTFLGALGDPARAPEHVSTAPLLEIRQNFDLYVSLRPATLLPNVKTVLADKKAGDIDIMIVRENTEGEYFDAGANFRPGAPAEIALQTAIHSRYGVERILKYGFETARKRSGKLTMATKSNALKHGMVFWDKVLAEMTPKYPDVTVDKCHIDSLCMNFVLAPEKYDTIVATNLFGDILSDLGGAIVGSLGLAPSCNLNPDREFPSFFEPVHGSAPDIAGQGLANPIASIRSVAMMFDFLGHPEAAKAIDQAVIDNLAEGKVRTKDLGGSSSTSEVGDDIAQRLS